MLFDWDPRKAESNLRKHGISFGQAAAAFADPMAVDNFDDSGWPDEQRSILIGGADNTILYVVYTEREQYVRIISARRATKHERNIYYSQNASR